MKTFEQFFNQPISFPATTGWYLSDLGEARGKQELFTRQSPQKLKVLREHALIESAVSSNRIEGVEVDKARIGTVLFGRNQPRDRDEEEIRGYRDALKLIHEQGAGLPLTTEAILQLHQLSRGTIWDAGKFKDEDGEIIERYPDGRSRVRFKPVSAALTPEWTARLIADWHRCLRDRQVPGLIALAAFNLDFLCIHPFRDGNGRVSRLLWLLQAYHLGYEVGRYISLERLIEQNKERYYETLEQSSQGWHEGKHDPWPFINYVLYIFKLAYKEFEERVDQTVSPKGAKTALIENAIAVTTVPFTISDLERACPGVSRDMIRQVLRRLKEEGAVESLGRGPGAKWQKKGNTLKRG
ncbi:MAG: Fic family protein [Blastocatellia bacterium]|nr:Fic family protein [Blastocatellia bacterium]